MLSPLFYKCVLHVGTREAGYMKMGPKIDEVWVLKSMIFVIFFDRFFGDFMFNFVSWPGRPDKRRAHTEHTQSTHRGNQTGKSRSGCVRCMGTRRRISTAEHSTTQQSRAEHSRAQKSTKEHSAAQQSTAQQSRAAKSRAEQSTADHSRAQQNRVEHSISTAQQSTEQHNTTEHRTAQHSRAEHSKAQHSTTPE